jgi:hypothetical protein
MRSTWFVLFDGPPGGGFRVRLIGVNPSYFQYAVFICLFKTFNVGICQFWSSDGSRCFSVEHQNPSYTSMILNTHCPDRCVCGRDCLAKYNPCSCKSTIVRSGRCRFPKWSQVAMVRRFTAWQGRFSWLTAWSMCQVSCRRVCPKRCHR